MDNVRAFFEDADVGIEADEEPRMEAPPEIGFDERRMHVRAYNYWVSLLGGRAYPSIEDLEPANLDDFGPHSVLLDFTGGCDNPSIAFVGRSLREQCELGQGIDNVSQVPSRSLLSRLTDHYLQIIANCAPIGFEAEFVSHKGVNTLYRGILMPLSSDGETIDFIYGVINWKELADNATTAQINEQVDRAIASPPAIGASPVWADGPHAMPDGDAEPLAAPALAHANDVLELGAHFEEDGQEWLPGLTVDADAGLADRLSVARETADAVRSADIRSRSALYRALGQAYDFALAAEAAPEDYAELLEDAGLKRQDRAPMTPVVKLIFGIDYDKTRLTEFAAALSYARRQDLPSGSMQDLLERFEGGLKGVVQAERRVRRPHQAADTDEQARAVLRRAVPLAHVVLPVDADGGEFVLLVARREADGRLAVIAPVRADDGLIDRAIRRSV
ncbi:MAG: hypothetical protein ACM3YM_06495 [Sphingomonadales bacterium]